MRLVELQNRGIGLLERYDYSQALEPLRASMELAPDWPVARYHLALALLNAGSDTRPEALDLLEGLAADEPDFAHAVFMAGVVAENLGHIDRAQTHYERAWKSTRDPIVGARLGGLLTQGSAEDEERAREILLEVHERAPALTAAVNHLMLLAGRRGELERQKELLAELDRLTARANPTVEGSRVGTEVQTAYGNLGRYSMAVRSFRLADDEASDTPGVRVGAPAPLADWTAGELLAPSPYLGIAVFDWDADGDQDLFISGGSAPAALLRNDTLTGGELEFTDVAAQAGVDRTGVYAVAVGEFDVAPDASDPRPPGRRRDLDLVLLCEDGVEFWLGGPDGRFTDATEASGLGGDPGGARAVLAFDADHEGDLDLFLSGGEGAPNRFWANRGPGVFEEVAQAAGLTGDGGAYGPATLVDVDADHDVDLLVTRPEAAPVLYLNDRLLRFRASGGSPAPAGVVAAHGVLSADLDHDGLEDVVLVGESATTVLRGRGDGSFEPRAVAGGGSAATLLDLFAGGRVDLVGSDGRRAVAADGDTPLRPAEPLFQQPGQFANVVAADLDGDGREELVLVAPGTPVRVVRIEDPPPGNAVSLDLEGVVTNNQAGWSNLEARGALVEIKAGSRFQMHRVGTPTGYGASPSTRLVAGVGPHAHADFVRVLWPDAVQSAALDVPAGAPFALVEEQRRPDSCPLLFSWDGERFAFVTDFIGAGGVGFLVEPGVFGHPDPTESVEVEASLVQVTADGELRFRLVEAMEETCYLDHADLLVVDHPVDVRIELDERFPGAPPFPSGELVVYRDELLPVAAVDGDGRDLLPVLTEIDRRYAPDPARHPRLLGATDVHVVELDFGTSLAEVEGPLSLCLAGWIEYGYTRTSVAAAGERFQYLMPHLEALDPATGEWTLVGDDLGYPAGFPRVMSYDLTGKLPTGATRLRIRTNFEAYWDRAWIAPRLSAEENVRTTELDASHAVLGRRGYPREFSPDGRLPRIYDYHTLDESMPWKTVEGDYTRFGDVRPLLTDADDRYVIHGKGEEIDLRFDARALPDLPDGWTRSYVLRFTGWCKGQELYTAHGYSVEPLPFLGMPSYPYPEGAYPDTDELRRYRAEWNTRRVRSRPDLARPR